MTTPERTDTREGINDRVTTDGTRVLPDSHASTDGTRALPEPGIDPLGGPRRLADHRPIGADPTTPTPSPRPTPGGPSPTPSPSPTPTPTPGPTPTPSPR